MGIGPTEIFKIGYEKLMENYDKEFDEIVQNRYNEYIRVYTIQQKFRQKEIEKKSKIEKEKIENIKNEYENFILIIKDWPNITPNYIKQYLPNSKNLSDKQLLEIRNSVLKSNFSIDDFKKVCNG